MNTKCNATVPQLNWYAEHGEDDVLVVCGMDVGRAKPGFCCEAKIVRNDGQWHCAVTPLGVVDGFKDSVVVRTLF